MNIVTTDLSAAERAFLDKMATLLGPFGMAPGAARLYALLLLLDRGPISLDEIAATLRMSRANAFYAARALEKSGHAHRSVERGSKRAFFEIASDVAPPTREQQGLLTAMGALLHEQTDHARSDAVAHRLEEKARFCLFMRDALDDAIRNIRSQVREPSERT